MPDHVDNAKLNLCLRKDRLNGLRESFKTVHRR
jgi:hypothetical protein